MRKGMRWTWILVFFFVSLGLAQVMGEPAMAAKKLRVAIGLDGANNDKGWYESGYQGAMKLKEDPGMVEVAFQERVKVADMERTIRRWAVEGYDLILGHGYSWGAPARKVAPEFPKTTFAVAGFFNNKDIPNLVNYLVQAHETGYMAGVLAALMTKSRKVGVIGGYPIPQQVADHNGFILGARSVNPGIEVSSIFINDWFDAPKAKEAAMAMIDQNVDVLDVTAQPMGFGSYKAAEERGVMAIGIYVDLRSLSPDTFIELDLELARGLETDRSGHQPEQEAQEALPGRRDRRRSLAGTVQQEGPGGRGQAGPRRRKGHSKREAEGPLSAQEGAQVKLNSTVAGGRHKRGSRHGFRGTFRLLAGRAMCGRRLWFRRRFPGARIPNPSRPPTASTFAWRLGSCLQLPLKACLPCLTGRQATRQAGQAGGSDGWTGCIFRGNEKRGRPLWT